MPSFNHLGIICPLREPLIVVKNLGHLRLNAVIEQREYQLGQRVYGGVGLKVRDGPLDVWMGGEWYNLRLREE